MRFSALSSLFIGKLFLLSLLIGLALTIFTSQSYAQTSTTTKVGEKSVTTQYAPDLNPDVPRDQHSYVQSVTIELMASMVCQLAGVDMIRQGQKCLGVDPNTDKIGFVENGGGAIGVMGNLIAATFTPPVSSTQYVSYLASNFGIAKTSYAALTDRQPSVSACANFKQGVGFCGIQPLLEIWVAMRNIAYLLFVIIFVLIGLAIMFRVHIDPRTVMTIENQIPKIIIGIILVTFSFAIAGLLIDVMYVAIYLIGGVLANIPGNELIDGTGKGMFRDIASSPTPFDAINRLWPGRHDDAGVGGGFPQLASQGSLTIRELVGSALNGSGSDVSLEPGLFDFIGNLFNAVLGLVIGVLAALIIFIALIFTAIRLWIILVVAYINILLDIIFAPFWFLIGLLPGSSLGVGAWFKDIFANLAVFPTTISMLILAKVFSQIAGKQTVDSGALFIPPLVGGGTGSTSEVFAGIVALGFLFMTPHVLNITRGAIKAPNVNYGPVFQPAAEAGGAIRGGLKTSAAISHDPMSLDADHRKRSRIINTLLGG